jgi:hypothetical protein
MSFNIAATGSAGCGPGVGVFKPARERPRRLVHIPHDTRPSQRQQLASSSRGAVAGSEQHGQAGRCRLEHRV